MSPDFILAPATYDNPHVTLNGHSSTTAPVERLSEDGTGSDDTRRKDVIGTGSFSEILAVMALTAPQGNEAHVIPQPSSDITYPVKGVGAVAESNVGAVLNEEQLYFVPQEYPLATTPSSAHRPFHLRSISNPTTSMFVNDAMDDQLPFESRAAIFSALHDGSGVLPAGQVKEVASTFRLSRSDGSVLRQSSAANSNNMDMTALGLGGTTGELTAPRDVTLQFPPSEASTNHNTTAAPHSPVPGFQPNSLNNRPTHLPSADVSHSPDNTARAAAPNIDDHGASSSATNRTAPTVPAIDATQFDATTSARRDISVALDNAEAKAEARSAGTVSEMYPYTADIENHAYTNVSDTLMSLDDALPLGPGSGGHESVVPINTSSAQHHFRHPSHDRNALSAEQRSALLAMRARATSGAAAKIEETPATGQEFFPEGGPGDASEAERRTHSNRDATPTISAEHFATNFRNELDDARIAHRDTFELELDPPELGKIRVQLREAPGGVEIQLLVADERAHNAAVADMSRLRAALQQAGVQVDQLNIAMDFSAKQDQQQSFFDGGSPQGRNAARESVRSFEAPARGEAYQSRHRSSDGKVDVVC